MSTNNTAPNRVQNNQQPITHRNNGHRRWFRTPFGAHYSYNRNGQSFVLMSYNILAQVGPNNERQPFSIRCFNKYNFSSLA